MERIKKKLRIFILMLIALAIIAAVSLYAYKQFNAKSAIKIETDPLAIVFINGQQVGKTPLEHETKLNEISLKLIPENFSGDIVPFETKVSLTKGVKTIVRHDFSVGLGDNETQIVSFEKIGGSKAAVAIVTAPDGARVRIDGISQGTTPLRVEYDSSSNHTIAIDARGYKLVSIDVKSQVGYLMTVFADLAKISFNETSILDINGDESEEQDDLLENTENKNKRKQVEIINTPTGFLRVREEASLNSRQVATVSPGEKYLLKSTDELGKWYEIILDASASGWVAVEYATISAKTY